MENLKEELNKLLNQLERADKLFSSIGNRILKVGKYTSWYQYVDDMRKKLYDLEIEVEKYQWDLEWNKED